MTEISATPVPTLDQRLETFVLERLEPLVERHFPDLTVPRVFAGHAVGADVRADLVYTLGHLDALGVGEIAGTDPARAITQLLGPIDGEATNTFFSYRIAETLLAHGRYAGNPLLDGLPSEALDQVARACDSTSWIELLDQGVLPANYAAVLARCELAREALGLADSDADGERLAGLVAGVAALLGRNPLGYLDDSEEGTGGRYDIYTADVYLFTEPFRSALGDVWTRGARSAVSLVERTAMRNGAAVAWGRSTGALAICLTVELAALVQQVELTDERDRWLTLAARGLDQLDGWFTSDGVISAHQHRSPYGYRGPARRLQMTLDCLGKLAWAARDLRAHGDRTPDGSVDAFPGLDTLHRFDEITGAAVWSYRSRHAAFVVPFVGPTRTDYLPAPQNPGLFEVPVDSPLATGVPVLHRGLGNFAGGGLPVTLEHEPEGVTAVYDGFPEIATSRSQDGRLAGSLRVELTVEGRTLRGTEHLHVEDAEPESISLQFTEARGRPLRVELDADVPHRVDHIDVDGLAEYRSFWGELTRVHQIDVEPARDVTIRWAVTPKLRVAMNSAHHHYPQSLYEPLLDRVEVLPIRSPMLDAPARALERLASADQFHLHWPEWFVPPDPEAARDFCDLLDRAEVRLVWTQHNLVPHTKDERHRATYQAFAERTDLAIHHSAWGRDLVTSTYDFAPDTRHVVVPHGHFGDLTEPERRRPTRTAAESELGLPPCAIRIGIVGAPRTEKHTTAFAEAFARCSRRDLQLVILSLADGERVPDDPRIVALPYEFVDRAVYDRRLAALDVVALPFDPAGSMLTTGVVADVIGFGLPAIATRWAYLEETLGDAALHYDDEEGLVDLLEALDDDRLGRAAAESSRLRADYDWSRLAEMTWEALEELGTTKL